MTTTTVREMPVRADTWRPTDPIMEGLIRRCIADAEAGEARDGVREYMAGALILAVLFVVMLVVGVPAGVAILVPLVLFGAGALYMVLASKPAPVDRRKALEVIGGPGNLPAGYLVHPGAWAAGMREHVAAVPQSQLKAAVEMARTFPGSVNDLLGFTGTIAAQLPVRHHLSPEDVAHRARDIYHIGSPIINDFNTKYPKAEPATGKKKKK
ncbi:hypothetical protein GCM10010172_04700 [Paractinoplanes ferrugineus]|uniref:Uncharacterized protein n=1 Tax=Paractinoplanes ferrugineus TaxID=113564 RepID=A0A919J446_9ACTN|nr:hypothetical protein [Actinoplanes ferrugineus]GIE12613.1 hypothetical protein Afe05nite_44530 [Actinoplanes ferrugineus]